MKRLLMPVVVLTLIMPGLVLAEAKPEKMAPGRVQACSERLHQLFENYYEERLILFPLEATFNGDHRYDDRLANDISEEHRGQQAALADRYSGELTRIGRAGLSEANQLSYDVLTSDLTRMREGLKFPDHWLPVGMMDDLPTMLARLGSGSDIQPFQTVKDYENFLGRVRGFGVWVDTAIANMRKGMAAGVVQPHVIMEKSVAQMEGLLAPDVQKSVFYQPVRNMPTTLSDADRVRLSQAYTQAIQSQIMPAYRKLTTFIRQEYLPQCRDTVGLSALPNGKQWYEQLVRFHTTTDLTADQLFDLGLSEVARITREMEVLKSKEGFTGDLAAFAKHVAPTTPTYRTKADLIRAYSQLRARVEPNLPRLFGHLPTSTFEIRPIEEFCEATSSTQMVPASPDGSRPAVFYVNAAGIDKTPMSISEATFLHETVPGHHLQLAIASGQTELPKFRRFEFYDGYGEGWALYAESLGADLGCYRDAGQRLEALGEEIFRARRLVVDTGLHAKGWTRDQARKYLLETPGFTETDAALEVDRYIGLAGQALSYKCGHLRILALRAKAQKALGKRFDLRSFHDELLRDGSLPLDILEAKMDRWLAPIRCAVILARGPDRYRDSLGRLKAGRAKLPQEKAHDVGVLFLALRLGGTEAMPTLVFHA